MFLILYLERSAFKADILAISSDTQKWHYIPLHHFTIIIIIIFDTGWNENLNTKDNEFISVAILQLRQHHQGFASAG